MHIRISWQQLTKRFASIAITFAVGIAAFQICDYQSKPVESTFGEISEVTVFDNKRLFYWSGCKPNPLMLIVYVDENRNVSVNGNRNYYSYANIDELSQIKKHLTEIFDSRRENKVFFEGTNIVQNHVIVVIEKSVKQKDVITLVEMLKQAGSDSVELEIEGHLDEVAAPSFKPREELVEQQIVHIKATKSKLTK